MTVEPSAHPGDARDPLAQQLLAHAHQLSRLQRGVDQLSSEVTDIVADLLARLDDLEKQRLNPALGGTPTSWCWRTLGPRGQEELWEQLTAWVDWIRARYPLSRRIPACWAEHPEIVEELTALWLAWVQAYETDDPPLTSAADWHDRWLPGVLHRIEHGPFALECGAEHKPRPAATYARA
jgi:hypothetical protein